MQKNSILKNRRLKYGLSRIKAVLIFPESSQKTALTITLGFYLSLFPVIGSTTILCILATFLFRLNPLLVQLINVLLFPFQLILIYPFLKAGRLLFFTQKDVLTETSLLQIIKADSMDTFYYLFESVLGGIIIWGILFATTGYFLYKIIRHHQMMEKYAVTKTSNE